MGWREENGSSIWSPTKEIRIFGPPGTGKTTYLARQIAIAADKHGADNIIVASFTRTAAYELNSRQLPIPRNSIGTLHALCYQNFRNYEIAELHAAEFNQEFPHYAISGEQGNSTEDNLAEASFKTEGDRLLNAYNLQRARMMDIEALNSEVKGFVKTWESWKLKHDYIDFTDMIWITIQLKYDPPNGAEIGFFDECQDFNKMQMQLVRSWGQKMKFFILGLDDDQCQPAGTMVLTPDGEAPIESLKNGDIVRTYEGYGNRTYKSSPIAVSQRYYTGWMYHIHANGKKSRGTDNHKWLMKWDYTNTLKKHCVYLMSKTISGKEMFRVGWCKIFRTDRNFHLGTRSRLEGAEKTWILKVFDSKEEATLWESYIAAKFRIPQMVFKASVDSKGLYTQVQLDKFWQDMMLNEQIDPSVFAFFQKRYDCPIWTDIKFKKFGSQINVFESCNLIPGMMLAPVFISHGNVEWKPLMIETEWCDNAIVYSLNIPKYHTYISDGIITHNCIFSFTGADPMATLEEDLPEDHKRILTQSYRVPRAVQEYAERWIKNVSFRQEKVYNARDEEGEVRRLSYNYKQALYLLDEIQTYIDKGKNVMFLATCGYMLDPLKRALRESGIPFHNPYRPTRGDWNPLGSFGGKHRRGTKIASRERLLAYLSSEEGSNLWNLRNLSLWMDMVKSKGIFKPKAKERVDAILETLLERPDMPINDFYDQIFLKDAIEPAMARDPEWLKHQLLASKISVMEYPFTVLKKKGKDALEKRPQVLLGTIHSVKGGEADVVVLFPDVSLAGYREWTQGGLGRDAVIRTFYVGMTRCRESLLIAEPSSQLSIRI